MTRAASSVRLIFLVLMCAIAIPPDVVAQTSGNPARRDRPRTTLWTIVGAAAGFGVGLWAGLTVFDDAVNSDRKVWTTAVLSAAGGGAAGYLIGRRGVRPAVAPNERHRAGGRSRPATSQPAVARLDGKVSLQMDTSMQYSISAPASRRGTTRVVRSRLADELSNRPPSTAIESLEPRVTSAERQRVIAEGVVCQSLSDIQ